MPVLCRAKQAVQHLEHRIGAQPLLVCVEERRKLRALHQYTGYIVSPCSVAMLVALQHMTTSLHRNQLVRPRSETIPHTITTMAMMRHLKKKRAIA